MRGYQEAGLRRCGNCHTVFAKNLPSDEELARHYDEYPADYAPHPLTWRRYEELLARFDHLREHNRLLDFGAGHGYFLEAAQRQGWAVQGVELADQFVAACEAKGFSMSRSLADLPPDSFDVVTALEVMEHVPDPQTQAELLARVVRPGGWVYITTPNFGSLTRRVLHDRWRVISYPEHLTYFTPGTLTATLRRAGLRAVEIRTSGLSVSDLIAGRAASGSNPGRIDTSVRSALGRRGAVRTGVAAVNAVLGTFRLGDTIKAVFERPS
jgi:2-polyprenyl-3-methyl-5-hydroxy-6-metoxy-1,4-benzoquinol methylase